MTSNKKRVINNLIRVSFLFICAILIVFFLPQKHTFSFDYTIGKPWKYGEVIAPFDFPIYKSNKTIEQEKDSITKLLRPYFSINTSTKNIHLKQLRKDIVTHNIKIPERQVQLLSKIISNTYDSGIIDSQDLNAILDSGIYYIKIVDGSKASVKSVKQLYTVKSAYKYIQFFSDSIKLDKNILTTLDLSNYLVTNLIYDRDKTNAIKEDMLTSVSYAMGMVQNGQKIIGRGEIVTSRTAAILQSLKTESIKHESQNNKILLILGQFLVVIIILSILTTYLVIFRLSYFVNWRCMALIYTLITLFAIATSLTQQYYPQSVYAIPFAIAAIFIRVFLDSRTAVMVFISTILLSSLNENTTYEFVVTQMLSSMVAIYSIRELTSRSQLLYTTLLVTIVSCLFAFGLQISQGIKFENLDTNWFINIIIAGIFMLFAYPVMVLVEKLFGFTSNVTLVELSNVNNSLIKQMSKIAQGTFNHSMQVANLATEVAQKIGANVQLVRTAALYHDIGKIKNPAFFIENQSGVNPHDKLSEEESAHIIIQHVHDGIEIANKYNLPTIIKEFIATHHGKSRTKYFYISYLNNHPNEPINEELFTYPGPNPQSLEQAIIMMADGVEASSRSLKEFTEETISTLVNDIIDNQIKNGYFTLCPITFRDITVAKEVFINSLKTIYHTRISYPKLNTDNTSQNVPFKVENKYITELGFNTSRWKRDRND